MKSAQSMRSMVDSFTYYEPCVLLEKIPIPIWMENKQNNISLTNGVPEHMKLKTKETEEYTNGEPNRKKLKTEETDEFTNEEPNRKKLKTEETDLEIPKLILSKNGDIFKSKLKYSKIQPESTHLYSLPDKTINEVEPSNKEKCIKINHDNKDKIEEIKESVTHNNLLIGKIKIRNVNTINANFTENNYFGTEKSNVSQSYSPFVFPPLGTKEVTMLCFEKLHKKYFNKNVQDTLAINNNLLFMNMITNMHSISRVNLILSRNDTHVMAQNVHKLAVLYINYFEKLDKMLQTNIIDLTSIFDDSDFEHGFLMIILSLFIGLKMLGSNIFQKSNILLTKLQKLQWEVIKDQNVDHNKIQTTLESDTFCSCYYKISELIGEGSHTDPNIIYCWKLLFIPSVLKITHFDSVTDAIINATDVDKLEGLLEEASNKVRQNSYSLSDAKIENLIALVNKSTQKNINGSYEMAEPSTSGFTTIENTRSTPMQSENTPHILHTRSLRTEDPNTAIIDCKSKVCGVENTSTFNVPEESKEWFKKTIPVQRQKKCTRKKKSESEELKTLYEDYSNTHLTNIHSLSIADRVKLRKTRNTLIAATKTTEDSRKKLRSFKSEYVYTPSNVNTRITRSSKLNINCVEPPKKSLKKIHAPNRVKVHGTKNTTTAVPSKPNDLLKIPFSIKNENSSFPQIFYTSISEQNRVNKNSPLLSTTSIIKHEEVCQVRNCCTKGSTNNCIHKNVNSTIKTVNVKHGLNGNKMIIMPKEQSVKNISKSSSSHNNGFNNA
ncbi:uncharacterized protein LOC100575022 [Acyrthosiphon pisum]|uniref:Uncharacterized protein n=1 Tax=Acyrthosiphon pisum TaxID=7029 RepID=A0A8R1W4L2_ACYPI|nr:uncharacterized protein LOC100575022 [Acyrthosiphon pisum]|eukprot:XP_003240355.1 PREDICTED: uncharacterized protein LOC100575022 [Acyrthosiphon pisum]